MTSMSDMFDPKSIPLTPFLFFTGKGGVGKTSIACATAISLADRGRRVLLVSTDPASNLQDVFDIELQNRPTSIPSVPNLFAANLDPEAAAHAYKEKVVGPYRGKLPESVLISMEEQLSGACTVEIAAFDEFSGLLTDQQLLSTFDHVLFDTAPTGHTLRLLQLPTAWSGFLDESTHGASCLGPLAGLNEKKTLYSQSVEVLSNPEKTTLLLVTRPEGSPLQEALRASRELRELHICNQYLLINGVLGQAVEEDETSLALYARQRRALEKMPTELQALKTFIIPLVSFSISGIENIRNLFVNDHQDSILAAETESISIPSLQAVVEDIAYANQQVIFTMGKGGVGKTTVAAAIAIGLAEKGKRVHLTTTDPAAHLEYVMHGESSNIRISRINPKQEVENYKQEVIEQAGAGLDEEGLAYLEEDLRSPCTEEIAVFRAFADIVEQAKDEVVVIDTAPTGHTLLLLDAAQSYQKEIEQSTGEVPVSVQHLLPSLRNPDETAVVIVTLAEATPVHEATRLKQDLKRAGILTKWWVINQSLSATKTKHPVLQGRASSERKWIEEVQKQSNGNCAMIPWQPEDIIGYAALQKLTL